MSELASEVTSSAGKHSGMRFPQIFTPMRLIPKTICCLKPSGAAGRMIIEAGQNANSLFRTSDFARHDDLRMLSVAEEVRRS